MSLTLEGQKDLQISAHVPNPDRFPFLRNVETSIPEGKNFVKAVIRVQDFMAGSSFKERLAEATGVPKDHQKLTFVYLLTHEYQEHGQKKSAQMQVEQILRDEDSVEVLLRKCSNIMFSIVPCKDHSHCRPIVIATTLGGSQAHGVLDDTLTVAALQKQIAAQLAIPPDQQFLVYKGKPISKTEQDRAATVSSLGIAEGDFVHIVQHLPSRTSQIF